MLWSIWFNGENFRLGLLRSIIINVLICSDLTTENNVGGGGGWVYGANIRSSFHSD